MPPKEKISKAKIQETAFEMTREYGFALVTARKLAEQLECSTQPIFRQYQNMEELKEDLFYLSVDYFCGKICAKKTRGKPLYMQMAISYIDLAQSEKHLFELIASVDDFGTETINEFIKNEMWKEAVATLPGMEDKPEEARYELFTMMWMFTHGMATLTASKRIHLSDKEIKELLIKAYEGFRTQY